MQNNFSCSVSSNGFVHTYLDKYKLFVINELIVFLLSCLCCVEFRKTRFFDPLLYILYVSDFGRALHHCNTFYADDLLIYIYVKPISIYEAINSLNEDIRNVVS